MKKLLTKIKNKLRGGKSKSQSKSSKLPKIFSIYVKKLSGESGFFRFKSYLMDEKLGKNGIRYTYILVDNFEDSSKFLNFDNAKSRANEIQKKFGFVDTKVLTDQNLEAYNLRKTARRTKIGGKTDK